MAGSRPLELGLSATGYSLGACGVGDEVYGLYGGQHRVVRRHQVSGLVMFGIQRIRGLTVEIQFILPIFLGVCFWAAEVRDLMYA